MSTQKAMLLSPQRYTKDQIEKIGQAIIFMAEKMPGVSKTKILKLVYLLDEYSIKSCGIPFFGLEYKVWQAGPVNTDLYTELSSNTVLLKEYIRLEYSPNGECSVFPRKKFSDDEFSENDLELLNEIVKVYKRFSAKKLVELCHRPSTLWYQVAKEKGVLDLFESGKLNTTDYVIPLEEYIREDEVKLEIYNDHKEFTNFTKRFKD